MHETSELESQIAILNEKYSVPNLECLKLFDKNDFQIKRTQEGPVYFKPKEMNIVASILITYWNEKGSIKPLSSDTLRIMGTDEEKEINQFEHMLKKKAKQKYKSERSLKSKASDYLSKNKNHIIDTYYEELVSKEEKPVNRPVISYAIDNNHWTHIRYTFEVFEDFGYIEIIDKDTLPLYVPTEKLMEKIRDFKSI